MYMKLSNGNLMWKDAVFLWTTAVGLKGVTQDLNFFYVGSVGQLNTSLFNRTALRLDDKRF